MDSDALVDEMIWDGWALINRLAEESTAVLASCWAREVDKDRWRLYIATPLIDREPTRGRQELARVLRSLGRTELDSSDIVLLGERHEMTGVILYLCRSRGGIRPGRFKRVSFRGMTGEEVYVYPLPPRRSIADLDAEQNRLLEELHRRYPLPVDDLAYSLEMEQIYREFVHRTNAPLTIRDVYKALKALAVEERPAAALPPVAVPGAVPSEAGTA